LDVSSEFGKDDLEWSLEAEAFSWLEIDGEGDFSGQRPPVEVQGGIRGTREKIISVEDQNRLIDQGKMPTSFPEKGAIFQTISTKTEPLQWVGLDREGLGAAGDGGWKAVLPST
jgi:hypothetical protein